MRRGSGVGEKNSLIWQGLLMELVTLTIWKMNSSLSIDFIGYAILELVMGLVGISVLSCGLRKSELEEDTTSRYYYSLDDIIEKALLLGFCMLIFHFFYVVQVQDNIKRWWSEYVAQSICYNVAFIISSIVLMGLVWHMVQDLLHRIWATAEVREMKYVSGQALRLRWWSRYTIIFSFLCLVYFFITGDSRSTPVENGILSLLFLGLHWGIGLGIYILLCKLEQPPSGKDTGNCTDRYEKSHDKQAAAVVGAVAVALGITAIFRYSSCRDFESIDYNHDKIILTKYTGDRAWVKIPEKIDGKQVLGMTDVFAENKKLRKVWLPDGLEWLGCDAFFGCEKLDKIDLPASLKIIGDWCFYGSGVAVVNQKEDNLEQVGTKVLTYTPWIANQRNSRQDRFRILGSTLVSYEDAEDLTGSLVVPEGVEMISRHGFSGDNSTLIPLEELYLPSGLREIGQDALYGMTYLKYIHIPETVQNIDESNFRYLPEDIVIVGKKGSEAERVAIQQGVDFLEEGLEKR